MPLLKRGIKLALFNIISDSTLLFALDPPCACCGEGAKGEGEGKPRAGVFFLLAHLPCEGAGCWVGCVDKSNSARVITPHGAGGFVGGLCEDSDLICGFRDESGGWNSGWIDTSERCMTGRCGWIVGGVCGMAL